MWEDYESAVICHLCGAEVAEVVRDYDERVRHDRVNPAGEALSVWRGFNVDQLGVVRDIMVRNGMNLRGHYGPLVIEVDRLIQARS